MTGFTPGDLVILLGLGALGLLAVAGLDWLARRGNDHGDD